MTMFRGMQKLLAGAVQANMARTLVVFVLLLTIGFDVAAEDKVRYIYARRTGEADLVFVADGKSFNEQELRIYLKKNSVGWPREGTELRLVFDGNVPISWWNHSWRAIRFLGFSNVRCYAGSIDSGRAVEIEEVGPSIALPDQRW
jgi:hypothetical protein